jgi:sugar lactone lactonase YvrE
MQELNAPNDIFVTTNETLYVADYFNYRVQIFEPNNSTAFFPQRGMGEPITVCVDNVSNYYVTEIQSPDNRISKWPSNKTILTLYNAYGIAIDSGRNLYLSTLSNTIILWNATSNITTTIVSTSLGLSEPRHIYLDEPNQVLYIADSQNNRIVKFRLGAANFTVVAGGHGAGIAANQLNYPAGVCVSNGDGTIYVADTNNNRVQKWLVNGTVGVTVLGNTNGTYGSGANQLNGPYSVALNAAETFLYVADSKNNRIQRISLC